MSAPSVPPDAARGKDARAAARAMASGSLGADQTAGPSRRALLVAGGTAVGAAVGATALGLAGPAAAAVTPGAVAARRRPATRRGGTVPGNPPTDSRVDFHRWTSYEDFRSGHGEGIEIIPGPRLGVVMSRPVGTVTYDDPYLNTSRTYEYSVWTSPVLRLRLSGNQLTSHWNAHTPDGTFLKVEMRAIMEDGHSDWWTMGIWTFADADLRRTSVNNQSSSYGEIDTDTWSSHGSHRMHAYQLRLTLYRLPGLTVSPRVWQIGAIASYVPDRTTVPASPPGPATGITLPVTPYAQNIHSGQYPQYGGGGEAWCSPTSTEMVSEYWGGKPNSSQLSWINSSYADPTVDYAARYTYDWGYAGTGNWPFNTAYAASFGHGGADAAWPRLDGMVSRLNSLWELEVLVAAGFPVITSQSFTKAEMGFYSTDGHLWVVMGFTQDGTGVIVNDPASNSDGNVYTVYDRREFEIVWLRTVYTKDDGSQGGGTGGICYIIKPHDKALPPVVDGRSPSWPGGQA